MTTRTSRRLSRADWLATGLQVLVEKGGTAMKAEPMARHLNTTKGSFYWHFRDVADFHAGLLDLWEVAAQEDMAKVSAAESGSVGSLRALAQAFADPASRGEVLRAETAIRAWAVSNADAARSIARVDASRIEALAERLSDTGIRNPEMARIVYSAAIGMAGLSKDTDNQNRDTIGSLVDLVLALR